MCSKHVEAWNKLIIKFSASSWLILRNKYTEMHGQQNIKISSCMFCRHWRDMPVLSIKLAKTWMVLSFSPHAFSYNLLKWLKVRQVNYIFVCFKTLYMEVLANLSSWISSRPAILVQRKIISFSRSSFKTGRTFSFSHDFLTVQSN